MFNKTEKLSSIHFSNQKFSISSGTPGLDYFLGGGFSFNTINLIEEDEFAILSNLLTYSFISNQIYNKKKIIVALPKKIDHFFKLLPKKKKITLDRTSSSSMKIAWRYNSPDIYKKSICEENPQIDFSNKLDEEDVKDYLLLSTNDELINLLEGKLKNENHLIIVILNYFLIPNQFEEKLFCSFLFKLKSLSRTKECTIIMTVNTEIISQQTRNYIHNLFDSVLSIEQIDKKISCYKDYDGVINIHKLPKTNLSSYTTLSETMDIGIKLVENRKILIVEKLSLPPETSETVSRTCISKIDF